MKKKIITFCAAVLFLTALGLTLYPLISNYVNQTYASEIQTAYQELIQQTDDSILQEAKQRAIAYNLAIIPGTADAYSEEALLSAAKNYDSQGLLIGCAAAVGVSAIVFLVVRIKKHPRHHKGGRYAKR